MDSSHVDRDAVPAAHLQHDGRQSSRSGPLPKLPLWAHDPPTGVVEALPPSQPLPAHWSFTAAAFTVFAEIGAAVDLRQRQSRPEPQLPPRRPIPGAGRGLARAVTEAFSEGRMGRTAQPLPRAGWDHLPEVVVASLLRDAGASDAEIRRFLTFGAAMNRGQDPDQLWLATLEAFRQAPWAFDPQAVADTAQIALVLETSRLSVSAQMDALAWRSIAIHLAQPGAIFTAVEEGEGNATALQAELEAINPATGAKRFPLLCAPRTAGRWVRMLATPGKARIADLDRVPLTVDGSVRRAGEFLGVTHTRGLPLEDVRGHIRAVWQQDVDAHGTVGPAGLERTAAALEPALTFLGRWGCAACERAGQKQPVADVCEGCILPERRRC